MVVVERVESLSETEDRVHVHIGHEARGSIAVAAKQLRQSVLRGAQGSLERERQFPAGRLLPPAPADATVQTVHRWIQAGQEGSDRRRRPGGLADRLREENALGGERVEMGR